MQIVRNIKTGLEFEATPDLIKFARNRNNNLEVIEIGGEVISGNENPVGEQLTQDGALVLGSSIVTVSGQTPNPIQEQLQEETQTAAEIIDPIIETAPVIESETIVEQPMEAAQSETVVEDVVTEVVEQSVVADGSEPALPLVDSVNDGFAPPPKPKKK